MKPSVKFILLFISWLVLLLPKKTAQACGFVVYPGEYRFWLLQPDLVNQPDLSPFFFAASYIYKGDMYKRVEPYVQQNIDEWFAQVNGNASKKDIDLLLNQTDPQDFFESFRQLAKENSFWRYVSQPKHRELYRYLVFSKKVERIGANPDPWEERIPRKGIEQVIAEGKALHASSRSAFVRLRTAYQLVRLYGYNDQFKELDFTYEKHIAPIQTTSWIKTAALYQKAIHAPGVESYYLLSKVFDRGGYNRTPCLVKFQSDLLDKTLKFAKNQHERNVLFAMRSFNYPGRSLSIIQRIYKSEPTYKELPFLLLREMNKVEDWLMTNKLTGFGQPAVHGGSFSNYDYWENAAQNYRSDKAYANALYQFLLQMIREKKNRETALLQLYAAHLSMLEGAYGRSELHLQQAAAAKNLPANVKTQIDINSFLLKLEKGFDRTMENAFMTLVRKSNKQLALHDPEIMRNQLILYTARKLIQNGNRAKGLLLLSKTNRALGELPISAYKTVYQEIEENAEEKDFNEMIRMFDKKEKSVFEHFVTQRKINTPGDNYDWENPIEKTQLTWSRDKLLDCKASWYIRHHRLPEALETMNQLPRGFYQQEPYSDYINGDPFLVNIYNPHNTDSDKKRLNKKQVVEQMIRLEQVAMNDPRKRAECYFQLANAWYNMTYHGKNWLMVKQWWSAREISGYNPAFRRTNFNDEYYGCQYAKSLYLKALHSTKDKKLAALSYFMVEQCNRHNRFYQSMLRNRRQYWWDYSDQVKPDYGKAKSKGVDIGYYKSLVNECELYQSFIRQYNRNL